MSYEQPDDNPLKPVEQALAAFSPQGPRLDRDRLMFLAGQASAAGPHVAAIRNQPGRLWHVSTAALAVCAAALGVALVVRPAPEEKIVYRDRFVTVPADVVPTHGQTGGESTPQPAAEDFVSRPATLSTNNYLRTRDVAFRLGLDALGTQAGSGVSSAPATTSRDWLTFFPVESATAEIAQPAPMPNL